MHNYGIPKKIVDAIRIIVDGHVSDLFDVKASVLQGVLLAPFLFIIVIDWIMRHTDDVNAGFTTRPRRLRRNPEVKVLDFKFADDICQVYIYNSIVGVQHQLDQLTNTACEVDLTHRYKEN